MIITIDGPVASGKSTVARSIAKELGIFYINSGMLYRALAYLLHVHYHKNAETIHLATPEEVKTVLDPARFAYFYAEGNETVSFDGVDITAHLKSPVIDRLASLVSTNEYVRGYIDTLQRIISFDHSVIIDGRDAGSMVFPDAEYKFFLTASSETRAKRWQVQQDKQGNAISYAQALAAIKERDMRDSQRAFAPLIVPEGAIVIDEDGFSIAQIVVHILGHIQSH